MDQIASFSYHFPIIFLSFSSFSLLKWPKIDPEIPHGMVKLRLHTPKLCISHPCLGVQWFLRFNFKQFLEIPPVGKNQSFLGFDNRFLAKCHQKK
jgi:hypothetical protein